MPGTLRLGGRDVLVRRATEADVTEVLGVLDEAAAWLVRRGIEQWPARFERAWLEGPVSRGETWLAVAGRRSLGTLQLAPADAAWEDDPPPARYVHRLAPVERRGGWAVVCSGGRRRPVRRGAGRSASTAWPPTRRSAAPTRRPAFEHAGDTVVHGPPGARSAGWPPVCASRYELRSDPAEGVTRR